MAYGNSVTRAGPSPCTGPMRWFAIYTKPRAEEPVVTCLERAGVEAFNPKIRIKKFQRYRLVENIEPLFPCYIFARFDANRFHHMVSYTRGVKYIVGREKPIAVQDEIIEAMLDNSENGVIVPDLPDLRKGDRVRINGGALKDFCGLFQRHDKARERVTILLEAIGHRVEVDKTFVELA